MTQPPKRSNLYFTLQALGGVVLFLIVAVLVIGGAVKGQQLMTWLNTDSPTWVRYIAAGLMLAFGLGVIGLLADWVNKRGKPKLGTDQTATGDDWGPVEPLHFFKSGYAELFHALALMPVIFGALWLLSLLLPAHN